MDFKLVIVTGGVISGIGKGVVAASIGKLIQARGFSVSMIKIDPYLNPDPGTLNPIEHGEVFVTEEVWSFTPGGGVEFKIAEIDEDFGHYERFLDVNMHPSNNITSGQVMLNVILGERQGQYLGQTIRLIPHVTDEIKRRVREVAVRERPDVMIVELGGTVGDYEAMAFVEALRQLRLELGKGNSLHVHVTYVPFVETIGEFKTKPAQLFFREVLAAGLPPDIVIARTSSPLPDNVKKKLALYASVPLSSVFDDPDLSVVYELPIYLERQGLGRVLSERLGLNGDPDLSDWEEITERFRRGVRRRIAMVGKYWRMADVYISIVEAIKHAGASLGVMPEIVPVDSEGVERGDELWKIEGSDGIVLTPGFGSRGTEGMISTASFALKSGKPFLGICFGAQLATVAFAREVMGWKEANSTEINPATPWPVVDLLPEQKEVKGVGGTMRLGGQEVILLEGVLRRAYGKERIVERFRHRYHIIREYAERMEAFGYKVTAIDPTGRIINAFEVEGHPYFVGIQFHPEFKSRPGRPSPTYLSFIEAIRAI
ncbi:MAG: CTP synthase [Candidatus Korarchaeota archaeon NZ13-K]|nr:MAG: CTP synthase [Candidatus Korarchaeota archaeon NZ13-K]